MPTKQQINGALKSGKVHVLEQLSPEELREVARFDSRFHDSTIGFLLDRGFEPYELRGFSPTRIQFMIKRGLQVNARHLDRDLNDEQIDVIIEAVDDKATLFASTYDPRVLSRFKGKLNVTCDVAFMHARNCTFEYVLGFLCEPIDTPLKKSGNTMLMEAAKDGNGRGCMLLIERGADPEKAGPEGQTPNDVLIRQLDWTLGLRGERVRKFAPWLLMDLDVSMS